MKLLYIEDEKTIAFPVIKILKKKGFEIDYFENGKDGLLAALSNNYDCIILDLNLPQIDGIEIAKEIRDSGSITPVLMLTARSSIEDKLKGFQIGTDDYLTKPFEILELIARINSLIKRTSENKVVKLTIEGLELSPDKNEVMDRNNKETIVLSSKEMGLFEYLLRHKGSVISSEELLEHVWDSNINIFSDTVKTHVKTLRKKLSRYPDLIKTIKGKGYIIS